MPVFARHDVLVMAAVVIENPIVNSPFDEPDRHWKLGDEGITNEVEEGRRPSSYFEPVPAAKRQGGQLLKVYDV